MNKISRILLAILMLSITMQTTYALESFIVLDSENTATMLENIRYIEENGGKIMHRFPPNVLIGDIPTDKIETIKNRKNIKDIKTEKIDISKIENKKTKIVANVWNNNYKSVKKDSMTKDKFRPIKNDLKILNTTDKKVNKLPYSHAGYSPPTGAGFYDTSEYMIGDIAVGVILPESNGLYNTNTEDWTFNEESEVISEINSGLSWWASQDPKARLTFTYDIYFQVPTNYEPISNSDQSLWINDAMNNLGFNDYNSYSDNVYDYNNKLRDAMETDWAYTIFVVDSSNDLDGKFPNGLFGYAYLGGPFTVLTYDNDGWGIYNMDKVSAHETGHIFYATDEYNQNTEYSGYLNAADITYSGCIMDNNNFCISGGTKLQLGWMDSNYNNIFDIIDFPPESYINPYFPNPTNNNILSYSGTGTSSSKYPNNNPRGFGNDITINKIINSQYRVDYGLWKNANPNDGTYDSSYETIGFTTPWLDDGYHTIDIRSRNTAGIWETIYSSDNILIDTSSISVTTPNGGENWQRGTTKTITWTSSGSPGLYVKIDLLKGGVSNSVLTYSTPNDGSFDWVILPTQTLGSDYKVRITSTSNSAITDVSDNNFEISGGLSTVTVTYPNGGEKFVRGTTKTLKWGYSGNPGSYVKIELLKGGVLNRVISYSTLIGSSGIGSYNWVIPSTQTLGNDYKVRITSTSNSAITDISNNNFIVSNPYITVISPNGGESWARGTTKTITWTKDGNVGSYVKIDLYKGGVFKQTIVANTPNDGSHPWAIPTGQTLGTDYKIKVTSTSNVAYNDLSNNNFKIY